MRENESTVRRELFGGAISLEMPERFIDVSSVRPLNDSQVFLPYFSRVSMHNSNLLRRNVGWTQIPIKALSLKFLGTMKT